MGQGNARQGGQTDPVRDVVHEPSDDTQRLNRRDGSGKVKRGKSQRETDRLLSYFCWF